MKTLFDDDVIDHGSASFSECGLYRYELTRDWGINHQSRGIVNWIMLNPSTATATLPDPTITRCINFSRGWGYSGLIVTNLFALRSTDPKALRPHPDPIGPSNDARIRSAAQRSQLVVCAWGNGGSLRNRAADVLAMIRSMGVEPHSLKMSGQGQPWHPLYMKSDASPFVIPC